MNERMIDMLRESMSNREIARELGVTTRTVRYWVSGEKEPNVDNYEGLKNLLVGKDLAVRKRK